MENIYNNANRMMYSIPSNDEECCVYACVCVFVYCHRALAEGLMRHSHSYSWTGEHVTFACALGH